MAAGLDEPPVLACPPGPLAEEARAAGLLVFDLRERSIVVRQSARDRAAAPLRLAGHARELRRLADDVRPDTFVAWGMRTMLAAAPALRRRPPGMRLVFQHNDFLPAGAIGRAVRAAAARADLVICLTRAVAADLGVPGAAVVHPGIDARRFEPGAGGDGALFLGAIVPWKRPELALEAASLAEVPLTVAGAPLDHEGEALLARLRERAERPDLAGRVRFEGTLADPRPALAGAGCLLHCADREPFGLALLEAMAAGVPVVAPDAGGPAEIVDPGCGAVYPPGDAAAAAAAIRRVLADRDEFGRRARLRVESEFALDVMQERYRELLAQPRDRFAGGGLAVVTVSHNSAPELARLLESVTRHLPAAQVIVADAGSDDDSASVARDWGAALLQLENVGFGRASNAALARVERPVTALVNPDVVLLDDSLAALARGAAPDRLLAPLVLNLDGSRQDSVHARPVSAAAAAHAVVPPGALPRPLAERLDPWRARRPRRAGWAIGACLVAPTTTLRGLGPFDESIFLYGEDLDLGLRAAGEGIETWFRPDARVVHAGGHSTSAAFGGEATELLAERRHEVVARRLGRAAAAADDLQQLTTFTTRRLLKRLLGRPAERERRQTEALRRARRVP